MAGRRWTGGEADEAAARKFEDDLTDIIVEVAQAAVAKAAGPLEARIAVLEADPAAAKTASLEERIKALEDELAAAKAETARLLDDVMAAPKSVLDEGGGPVQKDDPFPRDGFGRRIEKR